MHRPIIGAALTLNFAMSAHPPDDRFEQAKARFFDGLDCYRAGDFAAAEQHYLASLSLVPGRASTLVNLAATQLQRARPQEALATVDAVLRAEPDSTDALLHRGTALAQLGRLQEALATIERLLALDPQHTPAWSSKGSLLRELQRPAEAAQAFREAQRLGAEPDLHAYYLAAVSDGAPPATAPRTYVERLFDGYADAFDKHLVEQLHYDAPRQLVAGLITPGAPAGTRFASALDLGCGTGLCGTLLRPHADRLTGVDVSARMLARARALGVYDRLEQADIGEFLGRDDARHDLVLAADVFIYVGDLEPVFAGLRRALPRGRFCFSVEVLAEGIDAAGAGYRLQRSLRYAHSMAYVEALAGRHGFEVIAMERGPLRQDQREAIEGLYVHLRREGLS